MIAKQKSPLSSIMGGIGLLTLAATFSACVPVDPPSAPETRLNFVTTTDDGVGEVLKFWSSSTGLLTDVINSYSNVGIALVSGQPHGSAILYATGVVFGYSGGIGGYYTVAENEAGRYVRRLIRPADGHNPIWSPDGTRLAWVDGSNNLYIAPYGGAAALVSSAATFQWSPNGRKIIYSKPLTEARAVHVYDVVTAQDMKVVDETYATGAIRSFKWLSDNRHVVLAAVNNIVIDTTAAAPAAYRNLGRYDNYYNDIIPAPANDRFIVETGDRKYAVAYGDERASVPLPDVAANSAPDWSADGRQVYLTTDIDADGMLDVVITDADGQLQQSFALPVPAGDEYRAYNSPRRDKLAIVRLIKSPVTNDHVQLTVIDLPSGTIRNSDPKFAPFYEPRVAALWSPNGRYLAWGVHDNHMYLYDSNLTDLTSLLMNRHRYGPAGLMLKSWSPDSKHLVTCMGDYTDCLPAVITPTADDLTYTELSWTRQQLIWTGE